jgi:hypothetical protein
MPQQTITLTIDVPEGYELTGEFRPPKQGEQVRCDDGRVIAAPHDFCAPFFILRRTWQPPAWIPDGVWVYRMYQDAWFITNMEPITRDGHYTMRHDVNAVAVDANSLAGLHNDTFTPPPVNKIQVKRA